MYLVMVHRFDSDQKVIAMQIFESIGVYGPFDTYDQAETWAENAASNCDWRITKPLEAK